MRLHLFSTPGKDDLRYIIEASRAYLEDKEARVAYLPLASLFAERWLDVTQEAFKDLASVDLINTEIMSLPEIQDIYRRASLLYIPGGNTFCSTTGCISASSCLICANWSRACRWSLSAPGRCYAGRIS